MKPSGFFHSSCFFLSIVLFSLLVILCGTGLYFTGNSYPFTVNAGMSDLIILFFSFICFYLFFLSLTIKNLNSNTPHPIGKNQLFVFFILNLLSCVLEISSFIFISERTMAYAVKIPAYAAVGLVFSFSITAYSHNAANLFLKASIHSYRLYKSGISENIKDSSLLSREAESLIKYCRRLNFGLCILAVKTGKVTLKKGTFTATRDDLLRKLSFMMTDISRSHEPWFFSKTEHILFAFMQVKEKKEYFEALKRYSSELKKNSFIFDTSEYSAELYFASSYFSREELDFPVYENAETDFIKNTVTGIIPQFRKIN